MGTAKHEMFEHQDALDRAAEYLCTAGALKPCRVHSDTLIRQGDDDLVGTATSAAADAGEATGFDAYVREAYDCAADECPRCSKDD